MLVPWRPGRSADTGVDLRKCSAVTMIVGCAYFPPLQTVEGRSGGCKSNENPMLRRPKTYLGTDGIVFDEGIPTCGYNRVVEDINLQLVVQRFSQRRSQPCSAPRQNMSQRNDRPDRPACIST